MHRSVLLIAVTVMTFASACDWVGGVCTTELGARYTPADTGILVGQSFTPAVHLTSCGGSQILFDKFTWQSENPSVASVDSRTGRVVGQAAGETRITATGEKYGPTGGLRVAVSDQSP